MNLAGCWIPLRHACASQGPSSRNPRSVAGPRRRAHAAKSGLPRLTHAGSRDLAQEAARRYFCCLSCRSMAPRITGQGCRVRHHVARAAVEVFSVRYTDTVASPPRVLNLPLSIPGNRAARRTRESETASPNATRRETSRLWASAGDRYLITDVASPFVPNDSAAGPRFVWPPNAVQIVVQIDAVSATTARFEVSTASEARARGQVACDRGVGDVFG